MKDVHIAYKEYFRFVFFLDGNKKNSYINPMIFGNMGDMVGKVKKMQEDLKNVQKELSNLLVEENSGGVKVVVSGDMELRDLKLDPKILENNDIKRIEWLISDAVDKAFAKAKKEAANQLKKVTGGLSIPGLF